MPRNPDGTYDLPAGNPVVSGTTIDADNWANPTMGDIGAVLADSLSRTGKGGMQSPLKTVDGTEAAPGITFNDDLDTGLRRVADDIMALVAGGVDIATIAQGGLNWLADLVVQYTKNIGFENPAGNLDDQGAFRFVNSADGLRLQKRNAAGDAWVDAVLVGDGGLDPLTIEVPTVLQSVFNAVSGGNFGALTSWAYNVGLYLANSAEETGGTDAWRIINVNDELHIQVNTGTLVTPVWQDAAVFTPTTVTLTGLTLANASIESGVLLASATASDLTRGLYFSDDVNAYNKTGLGVYRFRKRTDGTPRFVLDAFIGANPLNGRPVLEVEDSTTPYLSMPPEVQLQFLTDKGYINKGYVDDFGVWNTSILGWYRRIGDPNKGFTNVTIEMIGTALSLNGIVSLVLPVTISNTTFFASCTRVNPNSSVAGNFPTGNGCHFPEHIDVQQGGPVPTEITALNFAIPRRSGTNTAPVQDGTLFCWHVIGTIPA